MKHANPRPAPAETLAQLSRVQARIDDLQSEAARLRAQLLASSDDMPLHPGALSRTAQSPQPRG
ncbi:hypothetical protein [Jannaschia pohangensis]|uniref:hypothetical protein n=1 Tax=Jannaschia pohangensis TaxID=390807 RepID=UPI000B847833|nr:hypothetical protein [Jannaschia pohangensis]